MPLIVLPHSKSSLQGLPAFMDFMFPPHTYVPIEKLNGSRVPYALSLTPYPSLHKNKSSSCFAKIFSPAPTENKL
jgi:hypothetical protein